MNSMPIVLAATAAVASAQETFSFNKDFEYGAELQENLGDKFASLTNLDAQATLDGLFNVDGVATTPLGQITAFLGDLAYPAVLTFCGVFSVYVVLQVLSQTLSFAYDSKVNIFSAVLSFLDEFQSGVFEKVVTITKGSDDREDSASKVAKDVRERRNAGLPTQSQLMDLLSGVARAINKFEEAK